MTDLHDNAALVRRLLEDRLEELLSDFKPGWIARKGKAWLHPDATAGNRLGSFEVDLVGAVRGRWYRHSQAVGGWVLELFAYLQSGEQTTAVNRETFDAARQWLGLPSPFGAGQVVDPAEVAKRRAAAEAEAQARAAAHEKAAAEHRLKRQARARDVWRASGPATGTLVAAYLAGRGLAGVTIPPTIRFHPALPYVVADEVVEGATGERRQIFREVHRGPAMVAGTSDGSSERGRFKGVHITWLAADGCGKAAVTDPKTGDTLPARKMIGPARGSHVRLSPPAKHIAVAEGIESALSIQHFGGLPTFAALSLGNLDARLPAAVESVLLCFDNDERDTTGAARAKRKAARTHAARGLAVATCAPAERADFNDLAMRVMPGSPASRDDRALVKRRPMGSGGSTRAEGEDAEALRTTPPIGVSGPHPHAEAGERRQKDEADHADDGVALPALEHARPQRRLTESHTPEIPHRITATRLSEGRWDDE